MSESRSGLRGNDTAWFVRDVAIRFSFQSQLGFHYFLVVMVTKRGRTWSSSDVTFQSTETKSNSELSYDSKIRPQKTVDGIYSEKTRV